RARVLFAYSGRPCKSLRRHRVAMWRAHWGRGPYRKCRCCRKHDCCDTSDGQPPGSSAHLIPPRCPSISGATEALSLVADFASEADRVVIVAASSLAMSAPEVIVEASVAIFTRTPQRSL